MEIELLEIRDFLAARAPFSALSEELLDVLPRQLVVRYLRRGSEFPLPQADEPMLYVIRSGVIELRNADGILLDKLGEGDLYAQDCEPEQADPDFTGIASEDTLLYLLSCKRLQTLREASPAFDRQFGASLNERLREAATRHRGLDLSALTLQVGDLLRRPPITIDADMTVQQAAQLMTVQKVSSVMLMEGNTLVGLITDSDLRNRCVARGLSLQTPAREIMTRDLATIDRSARLIDALLTMTRLHVHHLPVMEGPRVVGMLAVSDLIRQQSGNPAFIATDVRRAGGIESLAHISQRLPELQLQLANANATAAHIGAAIASLTDALTRRLLELAETRLGHPPVAYAWVAGGSQGRQEQTVHSDQDHALIIADEVSEADAEYFTELSRYVSDGLNACGFPYCPGDAMATNVKWRQPLRIWRQYFSNWIDRPQPEALMLASIFFDLRLVHGDGALLEELQQQVRDQAHENGIFLAHMVANALRHRPPLGFFRNFVLIHDGEHDATLDIKHRGIVPIVDLARVYALSEGITSVNTRERLQAAIEAGALSQSMGASLLDALEFISTLRIQHHGRCIRTGWPANNYLPPAELSELERSHLKDAFRLIQTLQAALGNRYQAERFA